MFTSDTCKINSTDGLTKRNNLSSKSNDEVVSLMCKLICVDEENFGTPLSVATIVKTYGFLFAKFFSGFNVKNCPVSLLIIKS